MSCVLVIDDEPHMVEGLCDAFRAQGFDVLAATDGEAGLDLALQAQTDLIVLDLMLPKLGGMEVCQRLRSAGVLTPILMLTARSEEADLVSGLESGADDYVTKPFSVVELVARARALLRRAGPEEPAQQVRIGEATVDFRKYLVFRGDRQFPMTDREIALLRLLIDHPHEVITRIRLLDEVWGYEAYPTTRTVDTFVYRLRQKLESDSQNPRHLLTVRGAGYKFVP